MITADYLHNVSIRKTLGGYNVTEVDNLLEEVEKELRAYEQDAVELSSLRDKLESERKEFNARIENLQHQISRLEDEKQEIKQKYDTQSEKIQDYAEQADELKATMIQVKRLSDQIIREAQSDADKLRSEAEAEAKQMIEEAENRVTLKGEEYSQLCKSYTDKKNELMLNVKSWMEGLMQMPESEEQEPETAEE